MADSVDYLVVGAGPAGCAVAARLAAVRPDLTVAILETGPERTPLRSKVPLGIAALVSLKGSANYAYTTTPQAGLQGRQGFQPRGRGVGGSSLINAMIYMRGQPQDYDGWAALGCHGWGWNDVLPYFKRSEDNARGASALHGVGGPLRVEDLRERNPATRALIDAAVEAGFTRNDDFNGAVQEGVGAYQVFQKAGRRFNAAEAYLGAVGARPTNLQVIANAQVRRIRFDGKRATGVVYRKGGAEHSLSARGEVILSAGAFGSPQLLMASGVGPAEHLREHGIDVIADRAQVGQNLQDHVDYTLNVRARAPGLFGITLPVLYQGMMSMRAWSRDGRGMLTTNVAEAGGFLKSDPSLDRPDLQLHFCIGIVDDHNRKLHLGSGYSIHVCVLRPHSRGQVRLASADVGNAPLIDPNFLSDPRDLDTLVAGTRISQRIMAASTLAAWNGRTIYGSGRDDDEALRQLIRAHADTIYHPVGTCRMGDDVESVVDPSLSVRGVEGLRVVDASIMPRVISGNTQAPCAMIGEKAADMILAAGRTVSR